MFESGIALIPDWARGFTIAVMMLLHVQFAAFLIGIFSLGVTAELLGALSRQSRLDHFAHDLARTAVLLYSTGAVIAIAFLLVVVLLWPVFWFTIIRVTFWPMVLEGITFVLTLLYLFPWYYTWNAFQRFKQVHISLGLALVVVAQLQQSMIDIMAGYMLTPAPPEDLLRVFLNPTAIPLDMHRIVGDISFAGFILAGFAAFRALREADPNRRAYLDWVGHIGLIAGLGFLFLQPAIGLSYAEEIRANSPGAFSVMMRGRLSWLFLVQIGILSGLFFLSTLYMWLQLRKSGRGSLKLLEILLVIIGLSGLLAVQPYVIGPSQQNFWTNWVNPIGSMQPWKYIALAGLSLGSLSALFVYLGSARKGLRWGELSHGGRSAQYSLVALAVLVSSMMFVMGYIRESSRLPYLIYYEMSIDQPQRFPSLPTPAPTPGPAGSNRN